MKLYTIRNWDKIYENSRSRAVESLSWVPVPNRHDGENFSAMMLHENGAQIFSAWILILQVASKCKERGVLKKENGEPHTPQTLSTKTRAPKEWFVAAFSFLEECTDWLVVEELADKPSPACHPPVGQPSPACQSSAEEENGMEEKEKMECAPSAPVFSDLPEDLKSIDGLPEAWSEWLQHRKENKWKTTPTSCKLQFEFLRSNKASAVAIVKTATMRAWRGLFLVENAQQQLEKPKKLRQEDLI